MWTALIGPVARACAAFYPRRRSLLWPLWLVLAVVLAFFALQVWLWLRPRAIPLSSDQIVAARAASALALDRFERGGGALPATAVVARFSDDPSGGATEALRAEIAGRDRWTLAADSPVKAFLRRIGSSLCDAKTAGELLSPGNHVGIDVIFYGRLVSASTLDGVSRVELEVSAYDARRGGEVLSGTFAERYPKVSTALGRRTVRQSRRTRIVVFALLVLALPWALRGVVERVRERKSNLASSVLMVGLFACDVLFGSVLFYGVAGRAILAAVGLLVLLVYNLAVCETIARRC